jgi:CDP-diacylglycerol--glycerol-3-phosphate 3-phosphatidyltransferase
LSNERKHPNEATAFARDGGALNWANALTGCRLVLSPLLFFLILDAEDTRGASWLAAALGFALAMSDYYDGKVARRGGGHRISRWGAFLDPLADKVVVLGSMICFVIVGRYWWLPVAIIAARELLITGYRVWWARSGLALPARLSAKYKTSLQGVALLMAALPPLEDADGAVAAALWVAVAITVSSGAQYLLDGRSAMSQTGAFQDERS